MIRHGHIKLDTQLATFVCQGTNEPRVVRLFPAASCSCPAVGRCYHVVAARLAVGIHDIAERCKINLIQLRKNTRKHPDKTSGRKRPRVAEVRSIETQCVKGVILSRWSECTYD